MDNWDKASLVIIGVIIVAFSIFVITLGVSYGTIIEEQTKLQKIEHYEKTGYKTGLTTNSETVQETISGRELQ